MSQILQPPAAFARYQRTLAAVGVLALAVCMVGAFFAPRQFFQSYLLAYVFWIGLVLGCLAILMMQYLTGGGWGIILRRSLESATRTLPLMIVLFIPLLFGLHQLYIWTHTDVVASDPLLQHKQPYLNIPFFIIRGVIYFLCWIVLVLLLNTWSGRQDKTAEPRLAWWLEHISGPGLFVLAITLTLAVIDWVMTIEPRWYSTIYAVEFLAGEVLAGFAFSIAVVALLSRRRALSGVIKAKHFRDLGNLLLTFVMLWAYCAFAQYLLIWSGNLREEIPWYLPRTSGGWGVIAIFLILFHFAVPFVLLLSRDLKEGPLTLTIVCALIFLVRFLDVFWLVGPAFFPFHFHLSWMDIVAPVGMGAVWLAMFAYQLGTRPLLPLNDPYATEALNAEE